MKIHNAPYATNAFSKPKFNLGDYVFCHNSICRVLGVSVLHGKVFYNLSLPEFSSDSKITFISEPFITDLSDFIGLSVVDKSNPYSDFLVVRKVRRNRAFVYDDTIRFGYWVDFQDLDFSIN